jgi:uncharacterized phage protein (TIGR01671 family)
MKNWGDFLWIATIMKEIGGTPRRRIEFRGKRLDNGEWVYGNLIRGDSTTKVVPADCCTDYDEWKVHPNTVGQYIGRNDVQNNRIYEGDIVAWLVDARSENKSPTHIIIYDDCGFYGTPIEEYNHFYTSPIPIDRKNVCFRLLGNIFDNPEMLKAEVCKDKEEEGDCPLLRKL